MNRDVSRPNESWAVPRWSLEQPRLPALDSGSTRKRDGDSGWSLEVFRTAPQPYKSARAPAGQSPQKGGPCLLCWTSHPLFESIGIASMTSGPGACPPVGPNARGVGLPYAPPGYQWGVGCRFKEKNGVFFWLDRYMWPPGVQPVLKKGVYLASKVQVESYIRQHDPAIEVTDLWERYPWHIPALPISRSTGELALLLLILIA
jgi:hypothetical protein